MERNTIVCADVLDYLRTLPDNAVNCVITSPPYYALRNYGVSGQIGLEDTPAAYIARLVDVFHEARRVLRDDGTAWVNLGDSYAAHSGNHDGYHDGRANRDKRTSAGIHDGFKPKDLMLMPARVAIALQDDGWYIRAEIIWHKLNPMPESVTDRPTKAHEMVYLLTKSPTYWYDQEAVREALNGNGHGGDFSKRYADAQPDHGGVSHRHEYTGRNLRDVWSLPSEPTPFAHFATFPRALAERCLRAGCPAKVCAACGAPWVREVERETTKHNAKEGAAQALRCAGVIGGGTEKVTLGLTQYVKRLDNGFHPTCTHDAATVPGVVLDPFMGSGTTALVAREWSRDYIGCDLSPDYVKMANERLAQGYTPPLFVD